MNKNNTKNQIKGILNINMILLNKNKTMIIKKPSKNKKLYKIINNN